jgi:succinoglycan biosynthesis transport protein ExoP
MNGNNAREAGDLRGIFGMLRRRMILIVVGLLIGAAAGGFIANRHHEEYSASAALLFRPVQLDLQLTGLPLQLQSNDSQRETATDVGLVTLPQVRARAAAALGPGYTADKLKHKVSVSARGKSALVSIKATDDTPSAAAAVANAMGDAFIADRRQGLVARIDSAIRQVQRELTRKKTTRLQRVVLRNNLTKLSQLRAVQPGDVQFVSRALPPTKPSSPKVLLDSILGGVLGLLVGLAAAVGSEALDRRVRRPDEVEDALHLPLLGTIPRSRTLRAGVGLWDGLSGADVEAFRSLRTSLRYRTGGRDLRSVLLTSAGVGSGKTTVALHLAAAAAAATDGRVLLIEADLRRPRLAELLGLPSEHGLSSALESDEDLDAAVVSVPTVHGGNGSGPDASFDVLVAGAPHRHATELLGSERMAALLREAASEYELTIVDGPPPGLVSDVIPLMTQVDGVILVARLGRENGPELRGLRLQLERLGVAPLGVVANFSRRTANPYVSGRR